jgi:putative flippase GtrA
MFKDWIIAIMDFFYPPFKRLMPVQTYRYIVCGGGNTLLDYALYIFSYSYILKEQIVYTPLGAVSPYIVAFLMGFAVSFPTGFFLNRNIVFPDSTLRGRVQLLRYFLLVIVCILLNYIFLKLFVEQVGMDPRLAKIPTMIIVISFSFLTQKYFTFKVAPINKTEL